MKYGYARCSTNEKKQDIDRQKRELKRLGVEEDNIFWEYEKGTKKRRKEFKRLFKIVEPGDEIITTEVSRLSRSTKQLCEVVELVKEKNLALNIGGSFKIDCRSAEMDPMSKGMIMMWGVFAELERDIISARVKSGMQNAREKGSKIGRPERTIENLPDQFLKYYPMFQSNMINISEFSRLAQIGRTSIYRYLKLIEAA